MLTNLTRRDVMKTMGAGAFTAAFGNVFVGNTGAEADETHVQNSPIPYELGIYSPYDLRCLGTRLLSAV